MPQTESVAKCLLLRPRHMTSYSSVCACREFTCTYVCTCVHLHMCTLAHLPLHLRVQNTRDPQQDPPTGSDIGCNGLVSNCSILLARSYCNNEACCGCGCDTARALTPKIWSNHQPPWKASRLMIGAYQGFALLKTILCAQVGRRELMGFLVHIHCSLSRHA